MPFSILPFIIDPLSSSEVEPSIWVSVFCPVNLYVSQLPSFIVSDQAIFSMDKCRVGLITNTQYY